MTDREFQSGDRVYHFNRGWGTYVCLDHWDTSTSSVALDSGNEVRITTARLLPAGHPDVPGPDPAGAR